MVATVAEPVARRINTANTQASRMTEMLAAVAHSASLVPMPVSTSTCLKPPPAATIRMMPATGGNDVSMHLVIWSRVMPAPRPSVKIPTTTAINSAISGRPSVSKVKRTRLSSSSMKMSTNALPIINPTGSSTLNIVMPKDGRRRSGARVSVCVTVRVPSPGSSTAVVGPPDRRRRSRRH